jgi:hypothetical protein
MNDPRKDCPWKCKYCECYNGEIARLRGALATIDAIAVSHKKGGLGKAQQVARAALEPDMQTPDKP